MRDGYRIVDTDCHQMENQAVWSDYIDAPFKGREPKPGEYKGKKYFCVEGEPVQPHPAAADRRPGGSGGPKSNA